MHDKSAKSRASRPYRRRTDTINSEAMEGEMELRMAVEATGLGIFDYYPLDGRLHWNHTAKRHFGLSPDAHVNYNVFLVGLHPDDRGRIDRLIHLSLERGSGGKYSAEYRTIGIEDGKERWISANGQAFFNDRGEAVRFIGTTLDITDRKRSEKAAREREERYRLLFDRSPLPKCVIDLERFAFMEVNDAAISRYGYSREEFRRLTLAEIMDAAAFDEFRRAITAPRTPGAKFEGRKETKHRTKGNEVFPVDVRYSEIVYNDRPALLTVAVDTGCAKAA